MIKNRDFIVFSDDWGRYPFSCQHIMQYFLKNNRIIWVNTIGMRNPTLSLRDVKRSIEKAQTWIKKTATEKEHHDNLYLCNPLMMPFSNVTWIRMFNKNSVTSAVGGYAKSIGFSNPILLTTLPITADYIGAFGERLSIYYCVDDYSEMPGNNPVLMRTLENALLQKVKCVCASSNVLVEKMAVAGHSPLLLAHGVDCEHFAFSGEVPPPVCGRRPTVGFFGAISPWLDLKLLHELATTRSDWDFVFIGPVDADVSGLEVLPNVSFPGRIDYALLPDVARHFDVALIPFQVNALTISVNPLKLMEYFALGLPVISTRLPEVVKHADLVCLGQDASEFEVAIERSLAEDSFELRSRRVQRAQQYSWVSVAQKFSDWIEANLVGL